MQLIDIENASRLAWPALEEKELPCGVLRFARGVSRRANSLTPLPGAAMDPVLLRATAEQYFHGQGLPAIIRVIVTPEPVGSGFVALDADLAQHGYSLQTPTAVMTCCLSGRDSLRQPFESAIDLDAWLDAWYGITGKPVSERTIHRAMLARLHNRHLFLAQKNSRGDWCCCGMAVACGDLLGIFGIATAPAERGKGHATRLMQQLLAWGGAQGSHTAFLQVECANVVALGVYQALGFNECYRYWYRERALYKFIAQRDTTTGTCNEYDHP